MTTRTTSFETAVLAADGARWALAAVLSMQALLGGFLPSVLDSLMGFSYARRLGVCAGVCDLWPLALVPWALFCAANVLQARALRLAGSFPYSNGQIALMILLPGYNLLGAVELMTEQGRALERLGAPAGVARELRAATSIASGVAVALAILTLRSYQAVAGGSAAWGEGLDVRSARAWIVLAATLLLARLYALARLQLATRSLARARAAGVAAEPIPGPDPHPGLPASRTAVVVAGLALAAAGSSLLPPSRPAWQPEPPPQPAAARPLPPDPRPAARPRAAAAAGAVAVAAPAPPPPPPREERLYAGRTRAWWQERVDALSRGDPAERALLEATLDRARANGLAATEADGRISIAEPGETP